MRCLPLALVLLNVCCVHSQADVDQVNLQVAAMVAIASGVSAVFSVAVMIWRDVTRTRALTKLAAGTAGAIESASGPHSSPTAAAILTESLPGTAAVEPKQVAALLADAKEASEAAAES